MTDTSRVIGITDTGQPLVPAEHTCEFWLPGKVPDDKNKTCWYCRYADFRKTSAIRFQSPCHCPHNRVSVVKHGENEGPKQKGGCER